MDDHLRAFLDILEPAERAALEPIGTRRMFRAGATALLEGDTASRLGIIRSGLVKVSASHPDGYEAVLAILGPGDVVGELAALDGGVRSASATVIVAAEIQFVTSAEFEQLIATQPRIAIALICILGGRLRESDTHRVGFAADSVSRRLARTLLQLAATHGQPDEDDAIVIEIPFTQEDLAGSVAASRDAVARALKSWRQQGLVETGRRRIRIVDPAALSRQQQL